ncbi:amylo-alpha-1,6-glucosidase [Ruminiclostridium cellulolyticum]|uniref:Glycogen debranching enzyme n=1 Tax=Ruminiclostridium cellulolyticum (strain ATCC 35319 / DSM 5812 / JCM 6584 / H10) TaxID=394503 RepID=B8I4X1_RUMCH|nr:amylo-alpha-1,6-glucosidase [Ruminiclostridium cellulolyticum]ACL76625.1 glycogen debranching enzyme [Ruminiclostridium cellulolyticum H10]
MDFGTSCWHSYQQGCQREWLVTNGIGGYASLSLICSNNRRYHGLLISASVPPTKRQLFLANVLEDMDFEDGSTVSLSSFKTAGGYVNSGFTHLQRVEYNYLPEFVYSYKDVFIKKKISMKQGDNTVIVQYEIRNGNKDAVLRLTPLVNNRDHHYISRSNNLKFSVRHDSKAICISGNGESEIRLLVDGGEFKSYNDCYFYDMFYEVERERGLDSTEDHFIPGCFSIKIKPWETKKVSFIATTETYDLDSLNVLRVIQSEEERLKELLNRAGLQNELCRSLVLAADNFIVYRKSTNSKTVIAGYPWFTDWGRDTMIAFSGLTLATGRYGDAKDILLTFSKYVNHGLIPNMFPDDGEEPAYNSVDAALWYFEAVYSYLSYTEDYTFIKENIYSCLKDICNYFIKGTIYDIKMTEDGLVTAGNENTQLTWMDAKVGDWIVTPRHGKAVEINALWYNALIIMSGLAERFGDLDIYSALAAKTKESFIKEFWNEKDQCLYDVINSNGKDADIRPNQILAIGLSFPVIDGCKAKKILNKVWEELYTPYGLRSLSSANKEYKGIYCGNPLERDGAYHQGTVWTWPLGRFIRAYILVNGGTEQARRNALEFIKPFTDHVKNGGMGSISEIFDGDNPHYPRGCFAQAWSVSEILRAAVEDIGIDQLGQRINY